MFYSPMAFLDNVDDPRVDYSAAIELGITGVLRPHYDPTYGWQVLRPVYNNTGSTIEAAKCVVFASGSSFSVAKSNAMQVAKAAVAGVTRVAIPTGKVGWVLVRGKGLYTADEDVDVDDLLFTDNGSGGTGNLGDPAVAGAEHCVLGRALAAVLANATGVGEFQLV